MLDNIRDNLATIAGILGSIGAIVALRNRIWGFFLWMYFIFTAPKKITEQLGRLVEDNQKIIKALFNGGSDGIVQNMDIIKAQSRANFEMSPRPMFICDNRCGNIRVNEAYCKLVGVSTTEEIGGTQWHNVLTGELRSNYIAGFDFASDHDEDFYGDTGIKNPKTGEFRGTWKIQAISSRRTEGGSIYIGCFIMAMDETAKRIVSKNGWDVSMYE